MVMSEKVLVLNVARAKIVRAAEQAIAEARRVGHDVTRAEARKLMRVARRSKEFALGTWYVDHRCGCLVGNLLGGWDEDRWRRNRRIGQMGEKLYRVGLRFDHDLGELLTFRQRDLLESHDGPTVVRAVDR